jgi:hypothetical protein
LVFIAIGFAHDKITPYFSIKHDGNDFAIAAIYVDDFNLAQQKLLTI